MRKYSNYVDVCKTIGLRNKYCVCVRYFQKFHLELNVERWGEDKIKQIYLEHAILAIFILLQIK